MRVLQAHNRHAGRGGADDVVDRERSLLEAAGHEVVQYFTPAADRAGSAPRQALNAIWNHDVTRDVARLLTSFEPDVLHVHTPFPQMSPAIFWEAARHGTPSVSTVHSYRYTCVAGTLRRDGRICEACVGRAVKIPAVVHRCYHDSLGASTAMAASLTTHRIRGTFSRVVGRFLTLTDFSRRMLVRDGFPPEHIVVKPNCVEDPGVPLPAGDRADSILFVGRLVDEKGIRTLLDAWRIRRGPGVLTIVGDGPLRDAVADAAAADPSVSFLGWQEPAVIGRLQREAALTVVPSEWYEAGPPLVLLQALAAGTPVVASRLENIAATVMETGAGATFAPGNSEELAEQLDRLTVDMSSWPRMSAAARALYERDHTPQASLQILEDTYASLVADGVR